MGVDRSKTNTEFPCISIIADIMAAGGMERQIVELLKGLKHYGQYKIAFGVLDHGGERETEALSLADTIISVRRSARFDVSPVVDLIRQLGRSNCRLIHTYGWMSSLAGLLAARWLRIPIVNGSIREAPARLSFRQRLSRWCALNSDIIVSNSKAGLDAYSLRENPKARVILNGIDPKRFEVISTTKKRDQTICMVANFSILKDHGSVIQAMPKVLRAFPKAKLILIGSDMGTLAQYRHLAYELGLSEKTEFLTNIIHPEPIIAQSDVCVLASADGEGISNSILEYMALGKPVIATDFPGNAEVIEDGKTGFLVPAGSPDDIANLIIRLFSYPEESIQIGDAGRRWVMEIFSLDRMISEYAALYEKLLFTPTS